MTFTAKSLVRSGIAFGLLASTFPAGAASFFPIKEQNQWVYRQKGGSDTLTIRVGTPLSASNGNIYYSLNGYANQRLWVREVENGNLYYFDEETGGEALLTSFEIVDRAWFNAPFRPCEQEGQPQADRTPTRRFGNAGGSALPILYRSYSCADAGVESEQYIENIGMTQRVLNTIAGPRVYELVSARLGDLNVTPPQSTRFNIELEKTPTADAGLNVTLRLLNNPMEPVKLQFPTSQDFEIVVRDEKNAEVYRWSEGQAFLQVVRERILSGELRYTADVPAAKLPPGRYTLEAWITAGESGRVYSGMTAFTIQEKEADSKEM